MAAHVVTGACVVLPTIDGSERYLYRGAPVGEGFTEAGIEHALDVGLIAVDTVREEAEAALAAEEQRVAAEQKAAADKVAAEKRAAEKKAAEAKAAAEKKAADDKAAAAAKP